MWQTLRKHPTIGSDPTDTAIELLKSTSRNLIVLTGAAYLAWHGAATTVWPLQFGQHHARDTCGQRVDSVRGNPRVRAFSGVTPRQGLSVPTLTMWANALLWTARSPRAVPFRRKGTATE